MSVCDRTKHRTKHRKAVQATEKSPGSEGDEETPSIRVAVLH